MSEQLSLLGDAAADQTVRVAPTARVLAFGAHAPETPRHRDVGALGSAGAATVRRMLELAEDALHYNQAPNPRLVVPEKRGRGLGSNGPIGRNSLMADGKGIRDFRPASRRPGRSCCARSPPSARTSRTSRAPGTSPRPTTT